MDITIPPHNLKRFAASITCLGKIGKDLYLSFDPLDGLTLSSLNDAKSAYGKFHFDSQFFERCSSPPNTAKKTTTTNRVGRTNNNVGGSDDDDDDDEFYDARYVCRVPVRSIHSILRPRKGVCSLRIKSEGQDDKGIYFGQTQKKKKKKKNKSSRGRSRSRDDNDDDEEGEDDNNDDGENNKRRGSMSARERSRSRSKRRKQTKLKRANDNNNGENGNDNENDPNSMSNNTEKMMLSFEFYIERPSPKSNDNHHHHNNDPNNIPMNGGVFRVLHKVGVTDANNVTLSASVTQRRTRSEIVSHPRLWLRLLDPLRRTAEVALTIDDELKVVTATSFHPSELQNGQGGGAGGGANAVLQAAAARDAVLKTETSTGCEEFDEYDFRNNRGKKKQSKRRKKKNDDDGENEDESANESENEKSGGEDDEGEDFEKESEMPPLDVNEKVILVFSIKEAKAMLQFCAQTNSSTFDDDEGVILSFHWGGRPIVIETDGDYFSGELVLATLHHGIIASNITMG